MAKMTAIQGAFGSTVAVEHLSHILKERKIDQRLPRVGGYVESCMLAYDFNITAYTR